MAKKTIKRVTKKIVTRKTKILKKSRQNIAKIVNLKKDISGGYFDLMITHSGFKG